MIPNLEDIVRMLIDGECSYDQAIFWIEELYGIKQRRDEIAIQAMKSVILDREYQDGDNMEKTFKELAPHIAKDAYEIANAMIAESNKQENLSRQIDAAKE